MLFSPPLAPPPLALALRNTIRPPFASTPATSAVKLPGAPGLAAAVSADAPRPAADDDASARVSDFDPHATGRTRTIERRNPLALMCAPARRGMVFNQHRPLAAGRQVLGA